MDKDNLVFFPAGPMKRLASYFFDRGLLYMTLIGVALVCMLIFTAVGKSAGAINNFLVTQDASLLILLAWTVYCIFLEGSRGATWGKRFMGCHVVDNNGQRISYGRAAVRFVASSLNWLTFGLGLLLVLFRKDRRGLHDIVAGTWVVHDDPNNKKLRVLGKMIIALYAFVFVAAFSLVAFVIATRPPTI